MFFCLCYSSMCGAIFLFGISPQHFKYCDTSVHSWAIFGDVEHWWKSNHCLIHHDGNGNPGNDGKPHISPYPQLLHFFLFPISNFLSSFSPQKVLSFTFFINIQNKALVTRAMLVWSVGLKDGCVTHYCLHVLRRAIYLKRVISSYMELVFFLP